MWDYYCCKYHQLIPLEGCKNRWEINRSTGMMVDVYCREVCRGKKLRKSTEMERRVHRNRIREVEGQEEAYA